MKKNSSNKLMALTASAMALPGLVSQVNATAAPDESEVSYRFSGYFEDDIPEERVITGTGKRYDILVNQLHVSHPINDNFVLTYEGSYETLSGASQHMSVYKDENDSGNYESGVDKVGVHMSGASIEESRVDSYVGGRYYFDKGNAGAMGGFSIENDYTSYTGAVDGALEFNDKHTTVSMGASFSKDELNPTPPSNNAITENDPGRLFSTLHPNRSSWSLFSGLGQIIDKNTVVQASVSLTQKSGEALQVGDNQFINDPYREYNGLGVDVRPADRTMYTFSAGVRKRLPSLDSAAHLDYRFFGDNWGIASNTLTAAYHQRITIDSDAEKGLMATLSNNDAALVIAPTVRYYQQSSADFYALGRDEQYFDGFENCDNNSNANVTCLTEVNSDGESITYPVYNGYDSSDPRLANFGAVSGSMNIKFEYSAFAVVMDIERYVAQAGLSGSKQELPNSIQYWRFTGGLDFTF